MVSIVFGVSLSSASLPKSSLTASSPIHASMAFPMAVLCRYAVSPGMAVIATGPWLCTANR